MWGESACVFLRLLEGPYGVPRAADPPGVHDVVLDHQVGADGADPKKIIVHQCWCFVKNIQDTF